MATTLPSVLTLAEVAVWLRLSPEAVVAEVEAGRLPVQQQQGDEWLFLREAVEAWSERDDMRQVLIRQVGVFADDESLPLLEAEIYRRRKENTLDTIA